MEAPLPRSALSSLKVMTTGVKQLQSKREQLTSNLAQRCPKRNRWRPRIQRKRHRGLDLLAGGAVGVVAGAAGRKGKPRQRRSGGVINVEAPGRTTLGSNITRRRRRPHATPSSIPHLWLNDLENVGESLLFHQHLLPAQTRKVKRQPVAKTLNASKRHPVPL
jgi:hypothetical protein